ncbi:hypothetical protein DERP_001190 [Dermatophagoides pteronyssinus]|uniref:Uncharacterized protein n=1 Tax=Dermatophagoides pteronyssinus TaxID=6956 RepID=A0ABQ8JDS6_DERPT|nr:hypothetical protein DERP_001190 [Dermatophagoides pteronyssinus]
MPHPISTAVISSTFSRNLSGLFDVVKECKSTIWNIGGKYFGLYSILSLSIRIKFFHACMDYKLYTQEKKLIFVRLAISIT